MNLDTIFKRPNDFYKRRLNPMQSYLEMSAHYLSRMKGISVDQATIQVKKKLKDQVVNPVVQHSERQDNGDQVKSETRLFQYLTSVEKNNLLLAPTFTAYQPRKARVSMFGEFMEDNIAKRSVFKKAAFKAKSLKKLVEFVLNDLKQRLAKLLNNSASGAFAQKVGVLSNPTSHSTLTSVTRSITSIANTGNEKMIYGNRYYPDPETVLNNCTYLATKCIHNEYRQVIKKYQLHIPTVDDCLRCLQWSSDLYFNDPKYYRTYITPYLEKLSDEERCAVVYSGDLYHFAQHNREIALKLLTNMAKPCETKASVKAKDVRKINERLLNLVHFVLFYQVKGHGTRYEDMEEQVPQLIHQLVGTAQNSYQVMEDHKDLIQTLFINSTVIDSSHYMKQMLRRSVVLSDTDSTCFSVDNWVTWAYGEFKVDEQSIALSGAVGFICTEVTGHQLVNFSVNAGVDERYRLVLGMKNEFLWHAHMPTQVAKHYFGLTVMQEGNVFSEPELEVKGVHLLNSTVPKNLIQHCKDMAKDILTKVASNEKLVLRDIIDQCIGVENEILESITGTGAARYLKKTSIKEPTAYKLEPNKSPYQNHTFWEEVFGPKYNYFPIAPYSVCKIPTKINNKREFDEWVMSLPPDMRERCLHWLERHHKNQVLTFYVSIDFLASHGIPKEMLTVVDYHRVQLDLTNQHRLLLEGLGVMLVPGILISEQL